MAGVFSSCRDGSFEPKERVVIYYIDPIEEAPEAEEEIINEAGFDKTGISRDAPPAMSHEDKQKCKDMFAELKERMKDRALLEEDLGEHLKDYLFLKRAVNNGRFSGFYERYGIVSYALDSIKIDEVFINKKYSRIIEILKSADPQNIDLIDIEEIIINVEQLIEQRDFVSANSKLNLIRDMLGK
jgi:hypothetical protein